MKRRVRGRWFDFVIRGVAFYKALYVIQGATLGEEGAPLPCERERSERIIVENHSNRVSYHNSQATLTNAHPFITP